MPFDQFTIEQLAGDMLPKATDQQRIATGFHRNTMFNEEGGVDREEAHWEDLIDRVSTTSTVWLGSTLACAQCHNHKYDPFTQKEFYQFLAFFNNAEMGSDEDGGFVEPKLELPTPEQEVRRNSLNAEIHELEQKLKTSTPDLMREQAVWEHSVLSAANAWSTLAPQTIKTTGGTTLTPVKDGVVLASGPNPSLETYIIETKTGVGSILPGFVSKCSPIPVCRAADRVATPTETFS